MPAVVHLSVTCWREERSTERRQRAEGAALAKPSIYIWESTFDIDTVDLAGIDGVGDVNDGRDVEDHRGSPTRFPHKVGVSDVAFQRTQRDVASTFWNAENSFELCQGRGALIPAHAKLLDYGRFRFFFPPPKFIQLCCQCKNNKINFFVHFPLKHKTNICGGFFNVLFLLIFFF